MAEVSSAAWVCAALLLGPGNLTDRDVNRFLRRIPYRTSMWAFETRPAPERFCPANRIMRAQRTGKPFDGRALVGEEAFHELRVAIEETRSAWDGSPGHWFLRKGEGNR